MSTTPTKELKDLTYSELKALLDSKKDEALLTLQKKETDLLLELEIVRKDIAEITGVAPAAPVAVAKRPYTRKIKNSYNPNRNGKAVKAPKKAKGQRGAVGAAITEYVASKGKTGAKVSEIAAATGNKPANVTAFFYAKSNRKKFKKVAPATFAVAK